MGEFSVGLETLSWAQRNVPSLYFKKCTSTNTLSKEENYKKFPFLLLTDFQTQGRGRNQNQWQSPIMGKSLLSSWIFQVAQSPHPLLSLRIGLALHKSLKENFKTLTLSLKAPNDIYINDKKLSGLLIETQNQDNQNKIIVGLGLNVFDHPESLSTSCALKSHTEVSTIQWHQWLSSWWGELKYALQKYDQSQLSPQECTELLQALNEFPLLKEKYTEVLNDGSLKTSTQLVHWSQL